MDAEAYVLSPDLKLMPLAEVPEEWRERLKGSPGDYVLTKTGRRAGSKTVDAQLAGLLEEFREPQSVVAAVLAYSRKHGADPDAVLDAAYPLLNRFVREELLVVAGEEADEALAPTLASGDVVDEFVIVAPIQILEDVEVYRGRRPDGQSCAIKIARPDTRPSVTARLRNEAKILARLDGAVSPELLRAGRLGGRDYLVTAWADGVPLAQAAAELRNARIAERLSDLLTLCIRTIRAYQSLHARGVVHGDVHPRNILVDPTGAVTLLDFGEATRIGETPHRRAGVAYFFEPEYAGALRRRRRPPPATPQSDQYALGALLYLCLGGRHYCEFILERSEMLRQIEEIHPQPLMIPALGRWPDLEDVLTRALAKDPGQRHADMGAFAEALSDLLDKNPASPVPRPAPKGLDGTSDRFARSVFGQLGLDTLAVFAGPDEVGPTASLDYGAAGIAYAFCRVAGLEDDPEMLALADLWASAACRECGLDRAFYNEALQITPASVGRSSIHHTANGVHFVRALVSQAMGDLVSVQRALDLFVECGAAPGTSPDLTLGRAGILLGCAHLLEALPDHWLLSLGPLRALGEMLSGEIWHLIDGPCAIGQAGEVPYSGMAHGWAGLLWAAFEWSRVARQPPPRRLEERLAELADLAEPVGRGLRWPIRTGAATGHAGLWHMPGWCNGAAGHVFLWTAAHRRLGEDRWGRIAEAAAWNAFEDPDRANNLCCGLTGRAYALLNAYRWSGDEGWRERARELATTAVDLRPEDGARSASLYKGDLGLGLLLRELEQPDRAALPAFEPEGWPQRPAAETAGDARAG